LNDDRRRIWYQPVLFYLIVIVLKLWPLGEATIRLPTALIGGVINPFLTYAVAIRMFRRRTLAALAALMVVAAPAHFILAREALDYICPLPFVLGWLWCLIAYIEGGHQWLPAAGGVLLGLGMFSFIASWIMMPIFVVTSWLAYSLSGRDGLRAAVWTTIGFALPMLVAAPWIWMHPSMPRDVFARYVTGSGAAIRLSVVRDKIGEYWDYFDPTYLFLTGGVSLTTSTGRAGVLPAASVVLLPLGLYEILKSGSSPAIRLVLLVGLTASAVPATLFGERYMVQRELGVVPFAALVATCGAAFLLRQRSFIWRALAVFLIGATSLQFAMVYRDYLTHYQRRAAFWYDPVTMRNAVEPIISDDAAHAIPAVYLSRALDDGGPKWRFYVTKHHRADLLHRTRYFDEPGELAAAPVGAVAILYANPRPEALLAEGRWVLTTVARDVDGRDASIVVRKVRE
jgi:4-amino-4-deoxy-L-arabinose transferase-like glycosyltransferase